MRQSLKSQLKSATGTNREVMCQYCGNKAKLVLGGNMYPHRKDLYHKNFWFCKPCNASVGVHEHSNNVPFGPLANLELRKARSKAHSAVDFIWQSGDKTRTATYKWLAKEMVIPVGMCHIGKFTIEQCLEAEAVANTYVLNP